MRRPTVHGTALHADGRKLLVRGVTYGTFAPGPDGSAFPPRAVVRGDFAAMAGAGVNAVRTYVAPPRWVLDDAEDHGLRVLVGLAWESHVAFLDDGRDAAITARVRDGVRACGGHPAVLAYVIGNEIPAPIVRWHGSRRIERFLAVLADVVRAEDPGALVTYANYPSTEYLQLPFLDVVSFNVFLEEEAAFDAYLARLLNLTGDRPLLLTESGLDSRRHGPGAQAEALGWQVRRAFGAGCAGAFVFAWTDEWHRGGAEVEDWDFGLVDRERRPKPALAAVRRAFAHVPFAPDEPWPPASVVVCTFNGARTLDRCLEGVLALDYPDFEVIVVDDGSTDATREVARRRGVRVVSAAHGGLTRARNRGLAEARGEVVAYLDDDAWPDPHWLRHLVRGLRDGRSAAVGGPNLPPPDAGPVAQCVANAPGGPVHVLVSDREAEHVPGCNMAFSAAALRELGGFDPRFTIAGDDVDVCWRVQDRGWRVAFSPAAVVWHRRRDSIRAFLRQQYEYGKAEAQLEHKWPERYDLNGHVAWAGHVYAATVPGRSLWRRWRIYYGRWGSAPFQTALPTELPRWRWLAMSPEWPLVLAGLAALAGLGLSWAPLLAALPVLVLVLVLLAVDAAVAARRARFPGAAAPRPLLRALTAALHVAQPVARLAGRLRRGLSPWRTRAGGPMGVPRPRSLTQWSETWRDPAERLEALRRDLRALGAVVVAGGPCDRWDLQARTGTAAAARVRVVVEEHGEGRQLARVRTVPRPRLAHVVLAAGCCALAVAGRLGGAVVAPTVLACVAAALAFLVVRDAGRATGTVLHAVRRAVEPVAPLAPALPREPAAPRLAGVAAEGSEPG